MEKTFKILSIDGGGIKGVYSASILKQIEQKYQCKLSDYFDMICGTSTGGLIALALSRERSAKEIEQFYEERGGKIFPYQNYFTKSYAFLRQLMWGSKYSDRELKSSIEEFIGKDTTMDDASTLLCIPSYNLTEGYPTVFKFPHKEGGFHRDANLRMVDVALATSAAPTYFPIAELDYPHFKGLFVDGGVWSNNPVLCGLLEALKYYVGDGKEFSSYSILSVASVTSSNGWRMGERKNKSIRGWGQRLFDSPLDGQNYFADFFIKNMIENISPRGSYLRIPSPEQLSLEHSKDIGLDKAGTASIKLLQSLGNQQGINYTTKREHLLKLDSFFKNRKQYIISQPKIAQNG